MYPSEFSALKVKKDKLCLELAGTEQVIEII
jgi:hypothetical protein